jgi:uncharacterized membrane protein YeaQ/YmgE (transglycosylase-associated protein family)
MKKGKKKATFNWWGNWTLLWIFGGFVATYLALTWWEAHALHWLFSFLGGVVGYIIGLFIDTGLPPVVRFVRRRLRRGSLKQVRGNRAKRKRWMINT